MSAVSQLAQKMQGGSVQSDEVVLLSGQDFELIAAYGEKAQIVGLARCTLERVPGKQNWVDEVGGLPNYICEIAKSIHQKRGVPVSRAIAIAVGTVKRWARGGGDVNADTRAKAAKAVASWEKKKAQAKAKKNKG